MVPTHRIKLVLEIIGIAATALLVFAGISVAVNGYRSSQSRCSAYRIQRAHVVAKCLETQLCAVRPDDIAEWLALRTQSPQCFRIPQQPPQEERHDENKTHSVP